MAVDGFVDFTPVQKRVLRALMERAQEVIVTVPADGRESFEDAGGEEELFHLSKKNGGSSDKNRHGGGRGAGEGHDLLRKSGGQTEE